MTLDDEDIALIRGMIASRAPSSDDIAVMQQVAEGRHIPIALDGTIITGSWNPLDGTVEVELGDTAALPVEDGAGPLSHPRLQLMVPMVGVMSAPLGGERCIIIPRQSGWAVMIEHGVDDVPQPFHGQPVGGVLPATGPGELTILNRVSGASITMRNDNAAGDKKGSIRVRNASRILLRTESGITTVQDDIAQTHVQSAGTTSRTMDVAASTVTDVAGTGVASATTKIDGPNKRVLHQLGDGTQHLLDGINKLVSTTLPTGEQHLIDGVRHEVTTFAAKIGLGDYAANLGDNAALILKSHLDAYHANLTNQYATQQLAQMIKLVQMLNSVGTMNGAQLTAALAALVAGWVPALNIVTPTGTTVARAK